MHAPILKYFTTVAELGTIRQASRHLHVSAEPVNDIETAAVGIY